MAASVLAPALMIWLTLRNDLAIGREPRIGDLVAALPFLAFFVVPGIYALLDIFRARNASITFDGYKFVEVDMWGRKRTPISLSEVIALRKRWFPLSWIQHYVIEGRESKIYVHDRLQGFKHLLMTINAELVRKGLEPVHHEFLHPGS